MILKKGNQKLHALMRISKYMSMEKLKLLMKTFIESQFNYCPLIWMFHSRKMQKRINRLHERALRVVYKDDNLTYEQLLEKDEGFTIHERNLQKLALLMGDASNSRQLSNIFLFLQFRHVPINFKENPFTNAQIESEESPKKILEVPRKSERRQYSSKVFDMRRLINPLTINPQTLITIARIHVYKHSGELNYVSVFILTTLSHHASCYTL